MSDDNIYRVAIHPHTKQVDILYFGLENVDTTVTGHYTDINHTPHWVREKVALLMMTNDKPPTDPVEGVGHRIDSDTFWVIKDE